MLGSGKKVRTVHANAIFYKLKKLKTDIRYENNFKKFKCFQETIIYLNFATICDSFHKMALLLMV